MKKAVCVILAAVLLACSGCSGRAPVTDDNAVQGQTDRDGKLLGENGLSGETADADEKIGNQEAEPGDDGNNGKADEALSEITVWIGGDLKTLDPAKALYNTEKTMLLHAYETLLIYDEDRRLVPGQAESYEVSPDGLTYTFHLRDGLTWSDGSKLTASDFVYSWKRLADHSTASPYAEDMLSLVEGYEKAAENGGEGLGVSAPNEKTFVVRLSRPWVNFPQICAYPASAPLKESYVTGTDDKWFLSVEHFVGNGPMKLTDRKGGWYITFEKNEHYWNQSAVTLKSLTFWLNGKEEALKPQFEKGHFQVMICDPEALEENERIRRELEKLQQENQNSGSQKEAEGSSEEQAMTFVMQGCQAPISGTYYIMLNMQEEVFRDVRVRKALSMVLDREYIAETVMEGEVIPASSLIGPGISDTQPGESFWKKTSSAGIARKEQQEETAKQLLEEAGYPKGRGLPVIEFLTNDAGHNLALANYLQEAWRSLGIQVKIRKVSWQNLVPYRHSGDFMAARGSWVMDLDDPLSLLEQFSRGHVRNDGLYSNYQVNTAIRQAKEATDRNTYYQALHQAEELLLEDNAVIPIAHYQDTWLQAESLTGIHHLPDGTWRFSQGILSSEPQ